MFVCPLITVASIVDFFLEGFVLVASIVDFFLGGCVLMVKSVACEDNRALKQGCKNEARKPVALPFEQTSKLGFA